MVSFNRITTKRPDIYDMSINIGLNSTLIKMQLATKSINTKDYPRTYNLLDRHLPSVLDTGCFNDLNLPFAAEVRETEIGHLFEHILIENLCLEKIKHGFKFAVYNGKTKWNWIINKYGTFDITVDSGFKDLAFFETALKKSVRLLDIIIDSRRPPKRKATREFTYIF